ncbi:MAG TPA: nicotinate phosphoribosyltransferase [Thermoanaerobaculia bacterium]|nr:nicotinate phosphoribosyltransferase [Thermoanaerobaculia bacterium]
MSSSDHAASDALAYAPAAVADSPRLALLTDLYQLTMACAHWQAGRHELPATFQLGFRKEPFEGAFAVFCGLEAGLQWMDSLAFETTDLSYLAGLRSSVGGPLFPSRFLDDLSRLRLRCHVDAMVEGTICFAREPLVRVEGPLWHCQILETALLNILNFSTLVATKAARICHIAAGGTPVFEFGLRRAQGIDGGLTAARAAVVGGCVATSNLLAGQRYGLRVVGTHAHSWVLSYENEMDAFAAYAEAFPDDCVLLVDTFDTERGVQRAVEVGLELARRGHRLAGVRLDSGDLAVLSQAARVALDAAGLTDAKVIASGDLDEWRIAALRAAGARIDAWGVGTRLATAQPDGALGGVYKLAAIGDERGGWRPVAKISEELAKSSDPGRRQVRRFYCGSQIAGDAIWELGLGPPEPSAEIEVFDPLTDRPKTIRTCDRFEDLLRPAVRDGRVIGDAESISVLQYRVAQQVASLPESARRLDEAHGPPIGLERRLSALRGRLVGSVSREAQEAQEIKETEAQETQAQLDRG